MARLTNHHFSGIYSLDYFSTGTRNLDWIQPLTENCHLYTVVFKKIKHTRCIFINEI